MSLNASPPAAVRAAHRVVAPKGGKAMNRAHILVVDDEPDLLELVQYNLAAAGHDVTCVGSGEEALAAVGSLRPDLVILDVLLPGMDGLDVCEALKGDAQTSIIPIVMLTARGEEADVVTGLEVGADDYLTKPFSPRELLARIKAALRRQRTNPVPDAEMIVRVAWSFRRVSTTCVSITNPSVSPRRNSAFCNSWPGGRDGCSPVTKLSIGRAAPTSALPSARWTCTSRPCAASWGGSAR